MRAMREREREEQKEEQKEREKKENVIFKIINLK